MSDIGDFVGRVNGFYRKSAVEQLILLAWYVEAQEGRACFDGEHMRKCFRDASIDPPDMSVYLTRLAKKKPPQLVKEKTGYRLTSAVRRDLDKRIGGDPTQAAVAKVLADLPSKLPDLAERDFLAEALNCYKVKAYRAAIVMAWNLAYDHLLRWIFNDPGRIAQFNAGIVAKYPKKGLVVAVVEDADVLKESEVIEIARTGKLLNKNTCQILQDKLTRRNMAGHPSRVVISQHQADDAITDVV